MDFAASLLTILIYLVIGLLCISGTILSCLSISGTWLISIAAILTYFLSEDLFLGWPCVVIFLVLSGVIEGLEFIAGSVGVTRKGGSKLAGLMAFIGGLLGAVLGSLIPVPVLGPLIGMFALSFLLVYAVEYRRLNAHDAAAGIAVGAVVARAAIILLKVTATMGMILYLIIALSLSAF